MGIFEKSLITIALISLGYAFIDFLYLIAADPPVGCWQAVSLLVALGLFSTILISGVIYQAWRD